MKNPILAAAIVFAGLAVSVSGAGAQGIKEGKWTMTMVTKMDGMGDEAAAAMKEMDNMSPEDKAMMQKMMGGMNVHMAGAGAGMSTSVTKCVTNENPAPDATAEEGCRQTHSISGNTVNFETVCTDSKSTGQMTYSGDSMTGHIKSHQTVDGQATDTTIEVTGQYVGPCDQ